MTGYKQPPESGRFKKGQSGNPKGRPKRASARLSQSARVVLEAAGRPITIREGGETRQSINLEALIYAEYKTALGGSAHAQRNALQRHHTAEIERRAQIDGEIEWGEELIAGLRGLREMAAAQGKDTSMPYPHPDDVIIDPERGIRFVGPTNAEEDTRLKWALRVRDVLFAQDAFDQRCWCGADDDDADTRPGTAGVLAWLINDGAPKRYRLSEFDVILMSLGYDRMTKRAFAKYLYQAWKSLGLNIPRGTLFMSVGKGKHVLAAVFGLANVKVPATADL
jgi:hypothetical protein